jgi:hypothetical protein
MGMGNGGVGNGGWMGDLRGIFLEEGVREILLEDKGCVVEADQVPHVSHCPTGSRQTPAPPASPAQTSRSPPKLKQNRVYTLIYQHR